MRPIFFVSFFISLISISPSVPQALYMTQRSKVPKFGDWDNEDDVPYSIVFEKARSDKRGGKPNPSDIRDFPKSETPGNIVSERETGREPESRGSVDSPLRGNNAMNRRATVESYPGRQDSTVPGGSKPESEAPKGMVLRARRDRQLSGEGDLRKPTDSPLHHTIAGDTPMRPTRQNVGSDRSLGQSPRHALSQTKIGGKVTGVSSPSRERKSSSSGGINGLPPSTPERSRLGSVGRGDETPDHGTVLPRFGDWDENDPGAAEGYSHIFSRVREERQTGDRNVPVMPTETSFTSAQNNHSKCCWCIPWGRS